MKKMLTLCLLVGLIFALPRTKAFIDNGGSCGEPHRVLPNHRDWYVADSSGNGYSAWTQMQECLMYNAVNDAVQFVCRGYSPTGILYTHQAPADFSFDIPDLAYDASLGNARYPSSIASDDGTPNGPHIGPACLDASGAAWGFMVGQYCSGGWYSSFWDNPVDIGPGDLNTHKNPGHQLPDGNILYIGVDENDNIYYRTMSPDLGTTVASGTVASGQYYWGYDCNGGTAYVVYYDATLNVYYRTTTDGVTWSAQQSYNMVWPNPYASNLIFWTQAAVDGSGNVWLVFDNLDNDDYGSGSYPYLGKVYVSPGPGQTCIEVSTGLDRNFHPTVAADGNTIVALWHSPVTADIDSLCYWNLFYTFSVDGGSNWTGPVNLTSLFGDRHGAAQLSKRLDATNGKFFYFFGVDQIVSHDPIWHMWRDGEGLDPMAWYWGFQYLGVEEQTAETPSQLILTISNPVSTRAHVSYAMPYAGVVTLKVYDCSGRLVRSMNDGYQDAGVHSTNISTQDLASGTYFVTLDTPAGSASETMVVVR